MTTTEAVVSRSSNSGGGGGSRWCPTPEQVMLLEGMYRGGLKTPTATQIQQITARLALYGKIQGKNVFYWFQNHKARDRQKLRKKLMAMYQQQCFYPSYNSSYHHSFPLLGGAIIEGKASCKNMINEWNIDQTCNKVMSDYFPLMTTTMMMSENVSPYSTRVTPKTLQLFPTTTTTTTSLKDDLL